RGRRLRGRGGGQFALLGQTVHEVVGGQVVGPARPVDDRVAGEGEDRSRFAAVERAVEDDLSVLAGDLERDREVPAVGEEPLADTEAGWEKRAGGAVVAIG